MKHMQKRWAVALCLIAIILTGCGRKAPVEQPKELNLYASFYPIYAVSAMITEEVPDLRLNCLVQPQDGCLRNYSLSDWDFALLRSADAVLIGGRGLESFEGFLLALGEDGPAVSAALYNLALCHYDAANASGDTEGHWENSNPHLYMKTEGMIRIAQATAANLIAMDPENEALYRKNLENAENRLKSLRTELLERVGECGGIAVAVLNEALVYVAEEYGMKIVLGYARESGEGLSGAALEECIRLITDSDAQMVLIEKQVPQALQEALNAAGLNVVPMDVLSTRRANEGYEGYFTAQRENAEALRAALANIGGNV